MGELKRLSECEELVMSIVWSADYAPDLAMVLKRVNEKYGKTWKSQTVSTFLTRLVRKGFLDSYRKGRYVYYVPKVILRDYRKMVVAGVINVLYSGHSEVLISDVKGLGD